MRSVRAHQRSRGCEEKVSGRRLLAGDRGDVGRDRVDLRLRQLGLERRHHALAVRDAVDARATSAASRRPGSGRRCRSCRRPSACGSSCSRPSGRSACPSPAVAAATAGGRRLLGGGRRRRRGRGGRGRARRRTDGGDAGDRGDVGGDVLRVLAGDEIGGHARRALLLPVRRRDVADRLLDRVEDLVVDDVAERRVVEPLAPRPGERVVEVRADLPLRSRVGERVARAALLLEQRLPVARVGLALGDAARAATGGGEQRRRRASPRARGGGGAATYEGLEAPTCWIASSRVG